jgi:chromate transporter
MSEMLEGAGAARPEARVTLAEIGLLFLRIGLTSFGGGLTAWIYREVVDRRRWLGEDEFLAGLTMAQILPGPNVVNLAIYVGQRLRGTAGGGLAAAAMLVPPMAVAVLLAGLVRRYGEVVWLHDLLEGVAAGAVGLTAAVGWRAARHATTRDGWAPLVLAAVFLAVGVLRWPMIPVVLCAAPLSLALARRGG